MCECLDVETDLYTSPPLEEAKQRIPPEFRGNSFFSAFDLYQYIAITDDRTCQLCMQFDKMIITGDFIRAYYPYLEIITPNQMLPHVHPNCRCTLLRVTDLADYITYTEPQPDFPSQKFTEPNYLTKELPDYQKGQSRSFTIKDLDKIKKGK